MTPITIPPEYWTGKGLLEKGIPWLTPPAIRFLEHYSRSIHDVLEFGSGGSTLFFSQRCRSVKTWESDLQWRKRVEEAIPEDCDIVEWLPSAEIGLMLQADIVLVDSDGVKTDRQAIASRAVHCVRRGGLLVLDNYDRYSLALTPNWDVQLFHDKHWSGKGTLIAKLNE